MVGSRLSRDHNNKLVRVKDEAAPIESALSPEGTKAQSAGPPRNPPKSTEPQMGREQTIKRGQGARTGGIAGTRHNPAKGRGALSWAKPKMALGTKKSTRQLKVLNGGGGRRRGPRKETGREFRNPS